MKILNVNMTLDPVKGGGTAERTLQMSKYLSALGESCTILTTDAGLDIERFLSSCAVDVVALPCINERFYVPRFSLSNLINLVSGFDIIHIMGHWTFLNVLVYFAAIRTNKPYVICPAGALQLYGRSKSIKRIYNFVVGKRIVTSADGYIAITKDEIAQFEAYGIDKDKISIIPNGISCSDFQYSDDIGFRNKYGLGSNPFILFVGRLNPIKGPDLLLKAFIKLNETHQNYNLVFAGPDGGMLEELIRMSSAAGLSDRVHFIGYLGGIDKSHAYHAAALLVIPSRQEAMSIVALEAGITGTPVLLTDKCGFNEIAAVGGGRVVTASVEGLKEGLEGILKDPYILSIMGETLKKYTSDYYAWGAIIGNYLELYRRIIKQ